MSSTEFKQNIKNDSKVTPRVDDMNKKEFRKSLWDMFKFVFVKIKGYFHMFIFLL